MTRSEFAEVLEEQRSNILEMIEVFPLIVETKDGDLPYWSVGIDKPEDLDRAIARFRATENITDISGVANGSLF